MFSIPTSFKISISRWKGGGGVAWVNKNISYLSPELTIHNTLVDFGLQCIVHVEWLVTYKCAIMLLQEVAVLFSTRNVALAGLLHMWVISSHRHRQPQNGRMKECTYLNKEYPPICHHKCRNLCTDQGPLSFQCNLIGGENCGYVDSSKKKTNSSKSSLVCANEVPGSHTAPK